VVARHAGAREVLLRECAIVDAVGRLHCPAAAAALTVPSAQALCPASARHAASHPQAARGLRLAHLIIVGCNHAPAALELTQVGTN
jgi:hypothetical protein